MKALIQKDTCIPIFIAAQFKIAKTTETTQVASNRLVYEDMAHMRAHMCTNEVLLSYKKEWNKTISSNVDRPRKCYD